jgi:hypothetical protein
MSKIIKSVTLCKDCGSALTKIGKRVNDCESCESVIRTGTWVISWLVEMGYIDNDDTVQNGYTIGKSNNNFLGLPNKTYLQCKVDKLDKNLFHVIYREIDYEDCDEDDYDIWWDGAAAKKIDFRTDILINIV